MRGKRLLAQGVRGREGDGLAPRRYIIPLFEQLPENQIARKPDTIISLPLPISITPLVVSLFEIPVAMDKELPRA